MPKDKPEIRFAGYTDAWVQRNLGEVVQKVKSYSLSRDVETEDDTGFEYIHYGDIHTQKADVIDGNTKLPSIVPGDYDLIQEGDVIVADASEDYLGIAEPAVVVNKPTENLVAGLHTIAIRPNGIHPLFLYYLLHTQLFKHFGYRTGTGLKVFGISYPNLAKFTFAMPTLDEQKAIANTLRDMDNLIAANQRKVDLLKNLKKGFLQKMFPKNEADKPEVRFGGYTDAWEKRQFKDILKSHPYKKYLAIPESDGKYEVIQQGDNPILGYANGRAFNNFNDVTLFGDHTVSLYKPNQPFFVATDGIKILSANGFDGNFLYTMLEKYKPNSQGYKRHFTILKHETIWLTRKTSEQSQIGFLFKQLDNLITVNQRKVDLLKDLKKDFLQKMFI